MDCGLTDSVTHAANSPPSTSNPPTRCTPRPLQHEQERWSSITRISAPFAFLFAEALNHALQRSLRTSQLILERNETVSKMHGTDQNAHGRAGIKVRSAGAACCFQDDDHASGGV